LNQPPTAIATQTGSRRFTETQAYVLAVGATAVGIAITRLTWPVFAGTPFVPLFAAVVVTTQWGSPAAGLVAILLTVLGAPFAFPSGAPSPWELRTLAIFLSICVLSNRVVAGRNRAQAALRASEAQLRATWEHAPLGAAPLDRAGRIERINPALERLLGFPPSACAGLAFTTFNDPDDVEAERQRFAELVGGREAFYQCEQRYRRRDGGLLWGRVTVSAIRGGPAADATGAIAVLEDITAQRQAELDLRASEQKLRQAHKMEAVGQLVAGVAHNFNNLLAVTLGYTDLLLERRRDDDLDRDDLGEIRRATERGAALTRQLLAFGRKHDAKLARVDLNQTVTGVREMLTRVMREDIQLAIEVISAPVIVLIDPHDLEQAILNLVINSRDALPQGGAIQIEVARETIAPPQTNASTEPAAPAEYARLRVRDNGTGMTPEVQAHLFEPFFTTKEVGQGTGLGLAFVHGIARHGGGFVTVQSAPGQGTVVSVYFPVLTDTTVETAATRPAARTVTRSASATILLVEDEAPVSTMMVRVLNRAGYRVLSAATPGEAFAVFEQHTSDIDLLLTDIVMPEMNGPALAQRLVAARPDLRILFVSGYSGGLPGSATATGKVAFLAKPFPSDQLVATVAGLLSARTRGVH
jgi:PAS domain S-box-containing protein